MKVTSSKELASLSSFATDKDVRFVDRSQFCEMLVSPRQMTRFDIPAERIRGIYDAELGIHFLIKEQQLFP